MSRIEFDLIAAISSLDGLHGIVGNSAEGRHNVAVLRGMVADAEHTINQLTRALREATEPPTFMGEPVGSNEALERHAAALGRTGPLGRALSVMQDVLTDIEDWEDKALAEAVTDARRGLLMMLEAEKLKRERNPVPRVIASGMPRCPKFDTCKAVGDHGYDIPGVICADFGCAGATDATEQSLGLHAEQADAIRELLDEHAPFTTGNLQTRVAQLCLCIVPPAGSATHGVSACVPSACVDVAKK